MLTDADSLYSGEHLYEKMIGGMFLGELVRLIVADHVAQVTHPHSLYLE